MIFIYNIYLNGLSKNCDFLPKNPLRSAVNHSAAFAAALAMRRFLFCRFLYHGYIGHFANPVHMTKNIKVVETNLSVSADQTVSTNPL